MTKEEIRIFYDVSDQNFLQWIHDRLAKVHNENVNSDYMLKLEELSKYVHNQRYPDVLGKANIKF